MPKYRKKPVVIEAVRWDGEDHRSMCDFLEGKIDSDTFLYVAGKNFYIDHNKVDGGLVINTLEGEHIVNIGDYIIKDVKGEFYPCKPYIFEQTYEQI